MAAGSNWLAKKRNHPCIQTKKLLWQYEENYGPKRAIQIKTKMQWMATVRSKLLAIRGHPLEILGIRSKVVQLACEPTPSTIATRTCTSAAVGGEATGYNSSFECSTTSVRQMRATLALRISQAHTNMPPSSPTCHLKLCYSTGCQGQTSSWPSQRWP